MLLDGRSELKRNWHIARDNWDALSASSFPARLLTFALSPPFGGLGGHVNHGPRTQRKICLTFDDGPNSPCTEDLLEALDQLGAPATFFCVGWNVMKFPEIVARAAAAGHEIANHSMYHSRKAGLLPFGGTHIDEAEKAIADAIGKVPRLYRPPWGWLSPFELGRLRARGYTVVGWDVYTRDWMLPESNGQQMALQALDNVIGGSIILFHDGCAFTTTWRKIETVRAIRALVPLARDRGFEFATVSEVIGAPAYAS